MISFLLMLAASGMAAAPGSESTPSSQIVVTGKGLDRSLFSPVGLVIVRYQVGAPPARTYGTSFLVGDCYALTSRRIFESDVAVKGRWVEFWADVKGDVSSWDGTLAQVVAEGAPRPEKATDANDWVLLRLKKCLGRKYGTIRLSHSGPTPGLGYILASFPTDGDFADGIDVNRRCKFLATLNGVARHNCAVGLGEAGSPIVQIIEKRGRKHLSLIAMLSSDAPPPPTISDSGLRHINYQKANTAIPVDVLLAKPQIAAVSD